MSNKIKAVSINRMPVDNQTVETLENLLASAKKGELSSLIYVDSYADGDVGSGWTLPPTAKMLLELEVLRLSFLLQTMGIDEG